MKIRTREAGVARRWVVAGMAALAIGAPALAQKATSRDLAPMGPEPKGRFTPLDATLPVVPRVHAVLTDIHMLTPPPEGGGLRGPCPQTVSSHTNANFQGGALVIQQGFSEGEIAAASYTIAASNFPIHMDLMEFVLAQQTNVQTTTMFTVMVWEGLPSTGNLIFSYSSNGLDLPHAVLPPGASGVNIAVSIDAGDPEQIIVQDNGSHTFSIGLRIDQHNNFSGDPCTQSPPANSNAFPTTDTSGLQQAANNWLMGLNCGPFGCPSNGGWARFSQLASFCRPSGDWIMRATWTSMACTPSVGACCLPDHSCSITTPESCANSGGTYQGDDTNCGNVNCEPPATGACCLPSGGCTILTAANCASQGGTYQGNSTICGDIICPQPQGRCCLPNGTCQVMSQSSCTSASGTYGGNGTTCAGFTCPVPTGACCFGASGCLNLSQADCGTAGGSWQGGGSTCAGQACVTGACCLANGSCVTVRQAACVSQNGTFRGPGTSCASANCPQPTGACCFGTGCLALTAADCATAGGAFRGGGTTCANNNGIPGADACEPPPCPADFNNDRTVNSNDVSAFLNQWFLDQSNGTLLADFDHNSETNSNDVASFLNQWFNSLGDCPM